MTNEELSPIAQFIVNTMNNKALKDAHAIQRVRELHYSVIDTGGSHCEECSDTEFGHYIDYPCPTIQVLDGEK